MKKLFGSMTALFGVMFALCAAPADEIKFARSIKHVDMGGEMLSYQNTAGLVKLVNEILPRLTALAVRSSEMSPEDAASIDQAVKSIRKLLNIGAIQAVATSSKEIAPGIYTAKCFALLDRGQKSILINPAASNAPVNWRKLPANTIVAAKFQINLPYAWGMIDKEIRSNPDRKIRSIAEMIDGLKESAGIDVNMLMGSLSGDVEFAVAGTSEKDLAVYVSIPDKNGYLSTQLKTMVPPAEGKNEAAVPCPLGNLTVTYLPGRIAAALRPEAFAKPAKTLASLPEFQQYAGQLPAQGNSYFILNISGELLDFVRKLAESNKEAADFVDMLKPVSLAAVGSVTPDGEAAVAVSNFSIPQFVQCYAILAPAATMLPALNKSRNAARNISCVNNMKQFALACAMYAADHSDALPKDESELHKGKYISEEICDDVIYFGAGWKISRIAEPSTTPVAICDQSNHNDDEVHVAFVDGHVASFKVPEDAGLRDIIGVLNKELHFKPALLDELLKKAAAYEEDDDKE